MGLELLICAVFPIYGILACFGRQQCNLAFRAPAERTGTAAGRHQAMTGNQQRNAIGRRGAANGPGGTRTAQHTGQFTVAARFTRRDRAQGLPDRTLEVGTPQQQARRLAGFCEQRGNCYIVTPEYRRRPVGIQLLFRMLTCVQIERADKTVTRGNQRVAGNGRHVTPQQFHAAGINHPVYACVHESEPTPVRPRFANLRTAACQALCGAALLAASAASALEPPGLLREFPRTRLIIESTARCTVIDAWVAATPAHHAQGLMFVTGMADHEGMLFVYEQPRVVAMWMRNTFIPLDMLFATADGEIRHVHPDAVPQDETVISSVHEVSLVVELNAGRIAALGIAPGDRLLLE